MDPLARLFGSSARLKLLRLFLFNDDSYFTLLDSAFRTGVPKDSARKELKVLMMAGVIKKKANKEGILYGASRRFAHYEDLQAFLRTTTTVKDSDILASLKKAGSLRLVALTGLFTGVLETKADLLVVGDKLDEKQLEKAVRVLEAELGRELRFASFTTEDFRYRVGVYDRLLRDIFDYPNRTILDKIGISGNLSLK
jgi:hypothetical protein